MNSASLLNRIVLLGTLLVIAVAPTQYGIEVAKKTYLCVVDPLVWLVAALWGLRVLLTRDWRAIRWPPAAAWLFLALAALSLTRSDNVKGSAKDLFQFVEYFAVAGMLFAAQFEAAEPRAWARRVFLATVAVVVACAAVQYALPAVPAFKVAGTFGNRNVFGGFLSLALPIVLGLLFYDPAWPRRLGYAALLAAGLAVTLSGATLLALGVAGVGMAAVRGRLALLATVALLAAFVLYGLPNLPRRNLDTAYDSVALFNGEAEVSTRYTEWQAASLLVLDNPLRGVGAGNYQGNVGRYFGTLPDPAGRTAEPDSQNLYLVLAATLGIPGLLAFAALLATGAAGAARQFARAPDAVSRGLALGLLGSLTAYAINCVWSPLLVRGIGVPLALVCALATTALAAPGRRAPAPE